MQSLPIFPRGKWIFLGNPADFTAEVHRRTCDSWPVISIRKHSSSPFSSLWKVENERVLWLHYDWPVELMNHLEYLPRIKLLPPRVYLNWPFRNSPSAALGRANEPMARGGSGWDRQMVGKRNAISEGPFWLKKSVGRFPSFKKLIIASLENLLMTQLFGIIFFWTTKEFINFDSHSFHYCCPICPSSNSPEKLLIVWPTCFFFLFCFSKFLLANSRPLTFLLTILVGKGAWKVFW